MTTFALVSYTSYFSRLCTTGNGFNRGTGIRSSKLCIQFAIQIGVNRELHVKELCNNMDEMNLINILRRRMALGLSASKMTIKIIPRNIILSTVHGK